MKTLKRSIWIVCVVAGILLAGYAVLGLLELPRLVGGKFSAEARDTNYGHLLLLVGVALAFTGLSKLVLSADGDSTPNSGPGSDSTPPEA